MPAAKMACRSGNEDGMLGWYGLGLHMSGGLAVQVGIGSASWVAGWSVRPRTTVPVAGVRAGCPWSERAWLAAR